MDHLQHQQPPPPPQQQQQQQQYHQPHHPQNQHPHSQQHPPPPHQQQHAHQHHPHQPQHPPQNHMPEQVSHPMGLSQQAQSMPMTEALAMPLGQDMHGQQAALHATNEQLPAMDLPIYPAAEAQHDQVIADINLFYSTLKRLHDYLGIHEKVPKVGGRELDLHMLYTNVTALGGCTAVIQNKQWRDAAESFHFPETITSVSYSLRKGYITFLWDYEQVYYWGNTGPRVLPPQSSREPGHGGGPSDSADGHDTGKSNKKRKQQDVVATSFVGLMPGTPIALTATARTPGQPDPMMVGSRGHVTIDSRFDAGYFCTIKFGKMEFHGMLYYPPPEHTVEPSLALPAARRAGRPRKSEAGDPALPRTLPRPANAKGGQVKDPLAPKPNKTPFNFFSVDARAKARDIYPESTQAELTKKVGEMWAHLSDEEKAPYVAMSAQDRARYAAEQEAYNLRQQAVAAASQAAQAAQAVNTAQAAMANQPLLGSAQTPVQGGFTPHMQSAGFEHAAEHHHEEQLVPYVDH